MVGRCTVWQGGVLCIRWYTVCDGGIMGVRVMYHVLGYTALPPNISP